MAIVVALVTDLPFWPATVPALIFYATLSAGPALLALLSRQSRRGIVAASAVAVACIVPYTVYSWLLFPVLVRALCRHLAGRSGWAKTAREPIVVGDEDPA